MSMRPAEWWKNATIYQIYPKSFQDTNGDGYGDLPGIIQHLDYLADLGIDGIWLTPIYASPQKDNGYDIADYRAIDPRIGTMEQFEELVAKADKRGIAIIMDLVLNHTSDQHAWFKAACSDRNSPYHDYYIWRDGTPGNPPNELQAVFGGPAWVYVDDVQQYYLGSFCPYQPDLNWDNPKVRQELYDMIHFWESKGVGGFRLDVIDMVSKEPDKLRTHDGPHLHEYIQELSREAFQGHNLVTVGETGSATVDSAKLFSNPDGSELSMVFQFEHMSLDEQQGKTKWDLADLSVPDLKQVFERWQTGLFNKGWNSLYWDNHDQPRIVSRFGDDKRFRKESAKMLAALLYGMQGTPYIFEGEEIGMTNVELPIEEYDDIEIVNYHAAQKAAGVPEAEIMRSIYAKGRDNARTPMQWSDAPYAGFSTVRPWLPVNPNYKTINVKEALADPDSIFHFYKKLIELRKQYKVFQTGTFQLVDPADPTTFCYTRDSESDGHLLVECNFTADPQKKIRIPLFEKAEVLISNYPEPLVGDLRPYEARILYAK